MVRRQWLHRSSGPHPQGGPRHRGQALGDHEAGFSLVELMIALLIGVGVLGGAVLITQGVSRGYNAQLDSAAVQEEARFALDWIGRTLQSAGSNPYRITTSTCPAAGTLFRPVQRDPNGNGINDDIRVQADINPPNGQLGGPPCNNPGEPGEDVTIAHDVNNLTITRRDNNIDAAAVPMTDGVITQLRFTYLDANRVVTTVENQIAFVRIDVTAQTPSRDENTGQLTNYAVTSEVRIRMR